MVLLVFYNMSFYFFKILLDIFMFICFNLGLASWKMHEAISVSGNVLYMTGESGGLGRKYMEGMDHSILGAPRQSFHSEGYGKGPS